MKKLWLGIRVLLFIHFIFYIFGCFIFWGFNPMNWWLLTSTVGRIITLILEIMLIGKSLSDD